MQLGIHVLLAMCIVIKLQLGVCHPLVHWIFIFSLQIKIHNGLITIFEQGKTNFDGSPIPAKPLVDSYI